MAIGPTNETGGGTVTQLAAHVLDPESDWGRFVTGLEEEHHFSEVDANRVRHFLVAQGFSKEELPRNSLNYPETQVPVLKKFMTLPGVDRLNTPPNAACRAFLSEIFSYQNYQLHPLRNAVALSFDLETFDTPGKFDTHTYLYVPSADHVEPAFRELKVHSRNPVTRVFIADTESIQPLEIRKLLQKTHYRSTLDSTLLRDSARCSAIGGALWTLSLAARHSTSPRELGTALVGVAGYMALENGISVIAGNKMPALVAASLISGALVSIAFDTQLHADWEKGNYSGAALSLAKNAAINGLLFSAANRAGYELAFQGISRAMTYAPWAIIRNYGAASALSTMAGLELAHQATQAFTQ